ncbi:unnamed protein product, partial [marine sediment metagenome]
ELMAAAQGQADYLASEYGANFPSWDMGHIGAGGTYAIDRAVAAGYNVGPGWNVVENWALVSIMRWIVAVCETLAMLGVF